MSNACRYFGISRESYYKWKRGYEKYGKKALINSKPYPENPKLRTALNIEEKILYLFWSRLCWALSVGSARLRINNTFRILSGRAGICTGNI